MSSTPPSSSPSSSFTARLAALRSAVRPPAAAPSAAPVLAPGDPMSALSTVRGADVSTQSGAAGDDPQDASMVMVDNVSRTTASTGARRFGDGIRSLTTAFSFGGATYGDLGGVNLYATPRTGTSAESSRLSSFGETAELGGGNSGSGSLLGVNLARGEGDRNTDTGDEPLFGVLRVDGNLDGICAGNVGTGQFCVKPSDTCTIAKHQLDSNKLVLSPGYYLMKPKARNSAFASPVLPLEIADGSFMFRQMKDEKHPKAKWLAVFEIARQQYEESRTEVLAPNKVGLLHNAREGEESTYNTLVETAESMKTPFFKRAKLELSDDLTDFQHPELQAYASSMVERWARVEDDFTKLHQTLQGFSAAIGSPSTHYDDQYTTLWSGMEAAIESLTTHQQRLDLLTGELTENTTGVHRIQNLLTATDSAVSSLQAQVKDLADQANTALQEATSASTISQLARDSVNHLRQTGFGDSRQQLQTQRLETRVGELTTTVSQLFSVVEDVAQLTTGSTDVNHDMTSRLPTDATVTAELASLKTGFAELKQLTKGGGIKMGSAQFDSYQDALIFCQTHLPADCYQCFVDIMSLLQRIDNPVRYAEEIQSLEVHATRVNRTPEQSAVVASFMTEIPPILAGPKESHEQRNLFNAMKTFDMWDAGDGVVGTLNRINQTLSMRIESIRSNIERVLEGHSVGQSLCLEMLTVTQTFWRELCAEINEFRRFLLTSSYGAEPYSAEAKEQCWTVILKMLRVFFSELRRARLVAEQANQSVHPTALYLWGTLEAHRVMEEFRRCSFRDHPKVYPQIVVHLFKTYVSKASAASMLASSNRSLVTQCTSLEASVTSLKRNYDSLVSRVATLERTVGHGNGPGDDASPKKRNRRRGNGGGDAPPPAES
ncbi:hypothetical protein ACHAXS_009126 [Conticribra weissflogii]